MPFARIQYPESPMVVGVLRSFSTLAGSSRRVLAAISRLGGHTSFRKAEFVISPFLDLSQDPVLFSPEW